MAHFPNNPEGASVHTSTAYAALRGLAAAYLHNERPDHTLQPTALVHEAYVKLAAMKDGPEWNGKSHFQAVAANAMRQILIDHARSRAAKKRGGGWLRITLTPEVAATPGRDVSMLALEDAMSELSDMDTRKARIVELRFFAGMTTAEAAKELGVSPKTAEADWYFARAWLRARLAEEGEG